ncbi:hypothetical protein H0H92_010427 [Tricholoma furcatifolium]|nr:hypothetical protein H0H92_010427 [Tricholoma furcatifolium]
MRRRLSKKQLLSGPPPTPSYTPSAGPSRPKYNFAKKQKKLPALVFVSYGQSLLQKTYLPEPSASCKRLRDDEESEEDGEEGENGPSNPFPDPRPRSRPSEYLRSRCPLCFGGDFDHSEEADNKGPNAIVCIDACFTQKRNRQERDPPRAHPRTVFVPEHDTNKMEEYVERLRGARSRVHKRHKATPQDDHFEGSLRIPKSVLDGCESGFTAADSRRQKASTQFFDDTALMALLCRHDIVLFIVNMRSAGEKQHYAVVLASSTTLAASLNAAVSNGAFWIAFWTGDEPAPCAGTYTVQIDAHDCGAIRRMFGGA